MEHAHRQRKSGCKAPKGIGVGLAWRSSPPEKPRILLASSKTKTSSGPTLHVPSPSQPVTLQMARWTGELHICIKLQGPQVGFPSFSSSKKEVNKRSSSTCSFGAPGQAALAWLCSIRIPTWEGTCRTLWWRPSRVRSRVSYMSSCSEPPKVPVPVETTHESDLNMKSREIERFSCLVVFFFVFRCWFLVAFLLPLSPLRQKGP